MTKKIRSTQPPEVLSLAAFIAENSKLKCHTLHLGSDKLSDRLNLSGISKGLILINGGSTGTGKTYMMTEAAFRNHGVVFAATKAVNAQQSHDTKNKIRKRVVNDKIEEYKISPRFTQVEQIKSLFELWEKGGIKINEIHFDEAQVIYEGGFRNKVEEMMVHLIKFAEKIPVFFYSATFIPELSPVEFDFTLNLTNNFRRDLEVFCIKSEDESKTEIIVANAKAEGKQIDIETPKGVLLKKATEIVDILCYVKEKQKKKILFFINDTEIMDMIKEALAKRNITAEVVNSDRLTHGRAVNATRIIESSVFSDNTDIDILLATGSLEAGINIENDIAVGSIQTAPEKVFQQLGRARGAGYFFLVAGTGNGTCRPQKQYRDSREVSILTGACTYEGDEHAACCDGFTTYMERASLSRNAGYVIAGLKNLGYHVTGMYDDIVATTSRTARSSFKKYAKHVAEHKKQNFEQIAQSMKISVLQVKKYADEFKRVENTISALQITISPEELIQRISKENLEYICSLIIRNESRKKAVALGNELSPGEQKDAFFYDAFNDEINKLKQIKKEVPEDVLREISDGFWTKIFLKDGDNPEEVNKRLSNLFKLFRFLIGFQVNEFGSYIIVEEDAWWKVTIPAERKSKICKVLNEVKQVMPVGDFCNHEQLNQVEVGLKYSPVKAKKKALTYINEIKF